MKANKYANNLRELIIGGILIILYAPFFFTGTVIGFIFAPMVEGLKVGMSCGKDKIGVTINYITK